MKHAVVFKGLLHGSAHVWLWRKSGGKIEVLVQRRAARKINWPHLYDKSSGGHICLGEEPLQTAVRKVGYELGLKLEEPQLCLVGVNRWRMKLGDLGLYENEFQWVYKAEVSEPQLVLASHEVEAVVWKPLSLLMQEVRDPETRGLYVPYGTRYFNLLFNDLSRSRAA